jgi:hypothetical protein
MGTKNPQTSCQITLTACAPGIGAGPDSAKDNGDWQARPHAERRFRCSAVSLLKFLLHSNPDGTYILKREGDPAPVRECESLVEGVTLAQELKGDAQMQLTVYDAKGRLLLRSFA